MEEIQAG